MVALWQHPPVMTLWLCPPKLSALQLWLPLVMVFQLCPVLMDDYGSDFESDDSASGSAADRHNGSQNGNGVEAGHSTDEEYSDDYEEDQPNSREDDDRPDEDNDDEEEGDGDGAAERADGAGWDGSSGGSAAGPGRGSGRSSGVSDSPDGSRERTDSGPPSHRHPALGQTRRRLQIYLLKARKAYSRGQGGRAVAQFVRAMALARFVHGDRHWRTLRCQVLLARAYLDLQDLPVQADEHAGEALTIILMYQGTELVPDGKTQVLHLQLLARLVRGQALVQLGQPAAAEDCLRKAADLLDTYDRVARRRAARRPLAELDRLRLRLHTWLGRASAGRGRLEPARAHLAAAEKLVRQHGDRPALVARLRELGQLELRGARRQSAVQARHWFRQSAQLAAECWGEDSPEHLEAEHCVLRAEGRVPDGDGAALSTALSRLHQRCLARLGAAHPHAIRVADHLIQVHTEQQYLEKATKECRDNTKSKMAAHGELSREVADSLRTLSQLYVSSGHLERAAEVSRRCWAIETLMYGRQDKRVLAARETLAQLERRLGSNGRFGGRVRSAASTATPSIDDVPAL